MVASTSAVDREWSKAMNRSTEPDAPASPYSGTEHRLLRVGWLLAFLGGVALVAPFLLPAWTPYGVQAPIAQQIIQYPREQLAPLLCGWGLVTTLPLVIASSQAFRRSPHESAMPIAAASLLIGLLYVVPLTSHVMSQFSSVHTLPLRDSSDWLTLVGSCLIVVGSLIVLAVTLIISWSDPRA